MSGLAAIGRKKRPAGGGAECRAQVTEGRRTRTSWPVSGHSSMQGGRRCRYYIWPRGVTWRHMARQAEPTALLVAVPRHCCNGGGGVAHALPTMIETLAQITGDSRKSGFVAGIVLWDDKCVEAAPIVRYMKGWSRQKIRSYCGQRKWTVSVVHEIKRERP